MEDYKAPTFAIQRIIFFVLLMGMTMFLIITAVILQMKDGKGLAEEPLEPLNIASMVIAGSMISMAFVTRGSIGKRAELASGDERNRLRFVSRLVPVVMLEGGCLFGTLTWLLNGQAVPALVAALVCLAIAIAIVPFTDPEAGMR